MNAALIEGVNMKHDPDALLARIGLANLPLVDPLRMALEAACFTVTSESMPAIEIVSKTAGNLPPNSTDFERGMAAGMAVILMANLGDA